MSKMTSWPACCTEKNQYTDLLSDIFKLIELPLSTVRLPYSTTKPTDLLGHMKLFLFLLLLSYLAHKIIRERKKKTLNSIVVKSVSSISNFRPSAQMYHVTSSQDGKYIHIFFFIQQYVYGKSVINMLYLNHVYSGSSIICVKALIWLRQVDVMR